MILVKQSLNDQEFIRYIHNAATSYAELEGNSYLIIGKNKKSDYYWFQCHFQAKNFMHLLGIKSRTLTADEFYHKALEYDASNEDCLAIKDCTPSRNHSRTALNEKVSSALYLFQIENARYMKVGEKDKIFQYVDFSYAYGNEAVLGFRKLRSESFPVTLIPRNIEEFATKKYRVLFVLSKKIGEKQYGVLNTEIKKGLFSAILPELPNALRNLIAIGNESTETGQGNA